MNSGNVLQSNILAFAAEMWLSTSLGLNSLYPCSSALGCLQWAFTVIVIVNNKVLANSSIGGKVPEHPCREAVHGCCKMRSPSGISLPRRSFSSSAALLVKVIAKMRSGGRCHSLTAKELYKLAPLSCPNQPCYDGKGFGGQLLLAFEPHLIYLNPQNPHLHYKWKSLRCGSEA